MKLATERNLLYAYTPMDIHNPHKSKLTLPVEDKTNGTTVYRGIWGAEEYMIIDVLCDMVRLIKYNNRKPRTAEVKESISSFTSKQVEEQFKGQELSGDFTIKMPAIPYSRIVTRYDFLRSYGPRRLQALFQRAANIQLTCYYRYKLFDRKYFYDVETEKGKETRNLTKLTFKPSVPQSLIGFEYLLDTLSYFFKFTTGLGVLFVNNIRAAEWEWLPSELYSLSNNAQNLYRKYLLTRKQGTEIRVAAAQIGQTLKLMTSNQTVRREAIERYLDELSKLGLVKWRRERGYRDFVMVMEKMAAN
jgi:hypothetical protein